MTDDTNIISQITEETSTILSDNISSESMTTEPSDINNSKKYFYHSPYFYIPVILSGIIISYVYSDSIVSVISQCFDYFRDLGGSGGGSNNPRWTPPTYPLYDPVPEIELEYYSLNSTNNPQTIHSQMDPTSNND